jgi:hypothetical protein
MTEHLRKEVSNAYRLGRAARRLRQAFLSNPYSKTDEKSLHNHAEWQRGWLDQATEDKDLLGG